METVIAVVVAIAVTAIVVYFVTSAYHKKVTEAKIGNAEEKAREIIDEAVKTAETKKREAMLEAKEESIRVKNDLDKEVKERRAEIQRSERRVVQKEENNTLRSIERQIVLHGIHINGALCLLLQHAQYFILINTIPQRDSSALYQRGHTTL